MPLTHPKTSRVGKRNLSLDPVFVGEGLKPVPRNELPADSMDPNTAYQIVHDELLLDGDARLNLATFVGTWMEPQAQKLYAETYDKSPHKILLLLKEVNYRESGGWRLREFLRDDGGRPATWDTATTTFRNGDARRGASTTSNIRTENMSSTIPTPKRVSPQI